MSATLTHEQELEIRKRLSVGDPHKYLTEKGWTPMGIPGTELCLYLDPDKPLTDRYAQEPVECMHREQTGTDDRGQPIVENVMKQVYVQDGTGNPSKMHSVPAVRSVFHPKAEPVNLMFALQVQMERDLTAALAEREQQKAKKGK